MNLDLTYVDEQDCPILSPSELKSIVRYLGIEVDDALEITEQTEV